jgi:hypothetical protein
MIQQLKQSSSGAGPANPTSAFPIFSGVLVAPSLVFCVLFCGSLFVLLFTTEDVKAYNLTT